MTPQHFDGSVMTGAAHIMKCQPQFFREIVAGRKTHDLRQIDRTFQVGDLVLLREWAPDRGDYTGRKATVEITYITRADSPCHYSQAALHPHFCILSIRLVSHNEQEVSA